MIRLDSICEIITKGSTPTTYGFPYQKNGINFVKAENIVNNRIELKTITQFISKEANKFLKRSQLKENDVLFSIAGTIGRTAVVHKEDLPANVNQALAIIRFPPNLLESRYIRIILDSPFLINTYSGKRRGVGMDNMSLGDLKELSIPIPPLNEQKRIVSKIEELFSKLSKNENTLQYLEILLQNLTYSFIGQLIIQSTKKYVETTVSDISEKIFKGIFDLSPTHYVSNGIPLLRISDIVDGKVNVEKTKYITRETHMDNKSTEVSTGDIILAKVGATAGVPEKIAIIPNQIDKANINQNLMGIKLLKNKCTPEFFYHWLRHPQILNKLVLKSKTTTFRSLRNSDLSTLSISLPPISEQIQIVADIERGISYIKNIETTIKITKKNLLSIRNDILKQAFEGKLVTQNPNHESGEIS